MMGSEVGIELSRKNYKYAKIIFPKHVSPKRSEYLLCGEGNSSTHNTGFIGK